MAALLLELEQLREALFLDLEPHADRIERALEQLVELPVALGGRRGVADDERRAVGLPAVAVRALAVTELLEQLIRGARIVGNEAAVARIVAGDPRRHRVLGAHRLALADDADLVVDLVGHGDRAPQRDSLLAEAADRVGRLTDTLLHVEVQVGDLGIDGAVELDAAAHELGPKLAVVGHEGRRHVPQLVFDVGLAALEREPAALRLLHDADLHPVEPRQPLALHLRGDLALPRIVSRHEVPQLAAIAGIGGEHDLRRARVALEQERPAAHRMRGRFVAIRFDRLARDRPAEGIGEHVREVRVRLLQPDDERVAVRRLQARHRRVIVEATARLRLLGELVEADDLPGEEKGVGRAVPGIVEALERVRVIERSQLALPALERRIVGKIDALPDPEHVASAVGRDLGQGFGGIGDELRGPRQVIVGEQRVEDRLDDLSGVIVTHPHRIESGLRGLEGDAQDLGRIGRLQGRRHGKQEDGGRGRAPPVRSEAHRRKV